MYKMFYLSGFQPCHSKTTVPLTLLWAHGVQVTAWISAALPPKFIFLGAARTHDTKKTGLPKGLHRLPKGWHKGWRRNAWEKLLSLAYDCQSLSLWLSWSPRCQVVKPNIEYYRMTKMKNSQQYYFSRSQQFNRLKIKTKDGRTTTEWQWRGHRSSQLQMFDYRNSLVQTLCFVTMKGRDLRPQRRQAAGRKPHRARLVPNPNKKTSK